MDDISDFDIDRELNAAGIDIFQIYEPYKQALGRVVRAEYLKKSPDEADLLLIQETETRYSTIRTLKDKHMAWIENLRNTQKEF
jgi:hypothetical protein